MLQNIGSPLPDRSVRWTAGKDLPDFQGVRCEESQAKRKPAFNKTWPTVLPRTTLHLYWLQDLHGCTLNPSA